MSDDTKKQAEKLAQDFPHGPLPEQWEFILSNARREGAAAMKERAAEVKSALEIAARSMEQSLPPEPSHACRPDDGCEPQCMEHSRAASDLWLVRSAIRALGEDA